MTSTDNVKSDLHSLLLKDTATADSSSLDYIRHLASLPLSTILSQPNSLSETSKSLHSSLSDLCAQNYALFINSHRYSSLLPSSLATITSQLTTLSKSLPPLNDSIADFTAASAPLFQSRKNVESIINNQHYLTDLLEIPQLMDTFVHNGYYEEAIDLSSSVSSLAKSEKYKSNALMQHICQLVLDSQNAMLSELLKSLSGEVKLHVCLRVVGYLKRMNVFREKELRVVFLSCRDQFLTQLLGLIEKPEESESFTGTSSTQNRDSVTLSYLKKYIDTAREHFFDIITYYNSTFPSSFSTSTSSYTSSSAPILTSLLLASYATHFLDILTDTLTRYLPHLTTPTSIFSIYNHLMYFGTSLGRLGIDIRSIIGTIFLERVETIMTEMKDTGKEELKMDLSDVVELFESQSLPDSFSFSLPSTAPTTQFQLPFASSHVFYHPLANYTNLYLSLLNFTANVPFRFSYEKLKRDMDYSQSELVEVICEVFKVDKDAVLRTTRDEKVETKKEIDIETEKKPTNEAELNLNENEDEVDLNAEEATETQTKGGDKTPEKSESHELEKDPKLAKKIQMARSIIGIWNSHSLPYLKRCLDEVMSSGSGGRLGR